MSEIASEQLLLVTTSEVPGWRIVRTFGLVSSEAVIAGGPIRDLSASLGSIVGGNISAVTEVAGEAREQAILSVRVQAYQLGANAVVGCSFDLETGTGLILMSFCGTAVRIESDLGCYEPPDPGIPPHHVEVRCEACGLLIPWMEPVCVSCAAPRPRSGVVPVGKPDGAR